MLTLLWPCDHEPRAVSHPFGEKRTTFDHEGVDILAPSGSTVRACADGVAQPTRSGGAYGNYVKLAHNIDGKQYLTYYAHLGKVSVGLGQTVKAGDIIGYSDNTGNSTGPHLHLTLVEVGNATKIRGVAILGCINPEPFLVNRRSVSVDAEGLEALKASADELVTLVGQLQSRTISVEEFSNRSLEPGRKLRQALSNFGVVRQ